MHQMSWIIDSCILRFEFMLIVASSCCQLFPLFCFASFGVPISYIMSKVNSPFSFEPSSFDCERDRYFDKTYRAMTRSSSPFFPPFFCVLQLFWVYFLNAKFQSAKIFSVQLILQWHKIKVKKPKKKMPLWILSSRNLSFFVSKQRGIHMI